MKRIGILTSGGDCQGLNTAMRGVAKALYEALPDMEIIGFLDGYKGLIQDISRPMSPIDFSGILTVGGTILGTSRQPFKQMKLPVDPGQPDGPTKMEAMIANCRRHRLDALVILGGNGTHKTANALSQAGVPVVTLPKTIDNDLWGTDHCPGYGSAAKYVATTCMEIYHDARVYDTGMLCVIEIMGRHAGWLTAAAAIATSLGQGPDLIYLPERDFDMDKFYADVEAIYRKNGKCIVAVSEGIHDSTGKLIAEYGAENAPVDAFGHKQLGGLAATLANLLKAKMGCKVRGIEFSLMQRCAAHCASATDVQESFLSGKNAVEYAVAGVTDKMVGFERQTDANGKYVCAIKLMDLVDVANTEKKVPDAWINEAGNGLNQQYLDYVMPLIQGAPDIKTENGMPRFANLKKIVAK